MNELMDLLTFVNSSFAIKFISCVKLGGGGLLLECCASQSYKDVHKKGPWVATDKKLKARYSKRNMQIVISRIIRHQ